MSQTERTDFAILGYWIHWTLHSTISKELCSFMCFLFRFKVSPNHKISGWYLIFAALASPWRIVIVWLGQILAIVKVNSDQIQDDKNSDTSHLRQKVSDRFVCLSNKLIEHWSYLKHLSERPITFLLAKHSISKLYLAASCCSIAWRTEAASGGDQKKHKQGQSFQIQNYI